MPMILAITKDNTNILSAVSTLANYNVATLEMCANKKGDILGDRLLEYWVEVFNQDNWDAMFFPDEETLRKFKKSDKNMPLEGELLEGLRISTAGNFEYVSNEDATFDELKQMVIYRYILPVARKIEAAISNFTQDTVTNFNMECSKLFSKLCNELWVLNEKYDYCAFFVNDDGKLVANKTESDKK